MKRIIIFLLSCAATTLAIAKEIRIGLIGLDTSHVVAFTKILNDPKATGVLANAKVTAAFRGGSLDIPSSADRLDKYYSALAKRMKEILRQLGLSNIGELRGRTDLLKYIAEGEV